MSCEPDGSDLPRFSASYNSRTSAAGSRGGRPWLTKLHRRLARAGGHAGTVHEAERGLQPHHDHRAGRTGIHAATQTADRSNRRQRPCDRNRADHVGDVHVPISSRQPAWQADPNRCVRRRSAAWGTARAARSDTSRPRCNSSCRCGTAGCRCPARSGTAATCWNGTGSGTCQR